MPQQSTPVPIVTITFLALGVISSVIAILTVSYTHLTLPTSDLV